MSEASSPRTQRPRPALWATIALAGLIAAGCTIAADAKETHGKANSKKQKFQCSFAGACLEWDNTQSGTGLEGNSIGGIGVDGYGASEVQVAGFMSSPARWK